MDISRWCCLLLLGCHVTPCSGTSVQPDFRGIVTVCKEELPLCPLPVSQVKTPPKISQVLGEPPTVHTVLGHLLRDGMEGRNSTNSTRALKLPDGTSAAWYILTIIGIYAVVFLFRLASNILRQSDKSLEDVYYSNLTSELKKKGLQSKVAKCSALTISNRAVVQPSRASQGPKCGTSGPQTEIQGIA
ncbi:small integral membrane protein 34 [Saccopteryx leptura]|uniref:small integral membrane protein 34 n=1 Tax=Saccopteryx leptura TaxID=249018 RepID=UPI00339C3BF9